MLKDDKKTYINNVTTKQPIAVIAMGGLLYNVSGALIKLLSYTTTGGITAKVKQPLTRDGVLTNAISLMVLAPMQSLKLTEALLDGTVPTNISTYLNRVGGKTV